MKTMLVPILAIAAAISSALPALALEQKDSADFDYKYEMSVLPTEASEDQDGGGKADFKHNNNTANNTSWLSLGTGAYAGTIKMAMKSNDYLISAADSGSDGDGWRSTVAKSDEGYTVEVKLKVESVEANKSDGACALTCSHNVKNVNAQLKFYAARINWGGNTLKEMDTTDRFHTYRIVHIATKNEFYVYVDGTLVGDMCTNAFSYNAAALNRLILGAAGGNYAGTVHVAYLRFTKGAYAPADKEVKQLASADFDYKYEMLKLPSEENLNNSGSAKAFKDNNSNSNWLTLGTGTNTGTVYMNISQSSQYLISDSASGTAGDVWMSLGLTAEDSAYTIETRLKITACTGNKGALLLNASYGVANENSWLQFFSDQIKWNDKKIADVKLSDWHTYRLVAEDNQYQVYVDGVLVSGDTPLGNGFNYGTALNRLLFGGNSNYAGAAQVAYFRLTKGAYAPVDTVARTSDEFGVKYEMTDSDTRISASANASDWTISGNSGATITKSNGVLSIVPNGKQPYWQTTTTAWKNGANNVSAFTIDIAIKINKCTLTDGSDRAFQLIAGTPNAKGVLNIGKNHIYWQTTDSKANNIVLDSSDNSDKSHVFRISYDGKTRHSFNVWRDGVKIGECLVDNTGWSGVVFNFVRLGVTGGTVGGEFDIDYIRWDTTGAYDWKDLPMGLMILLK